MQNLKTLTLTLILNGLLIACTSGDGDGVGTNSKVDLSRMHARTKILLNLDESKVNARAAHSIVDLKNVDLAKEYKLVGPDIYKPIFHKYIGEMEEKAPYELGTRYLTRNLTTWETANCQIIDETLTVVLVAKSDDFQTLEFTSIDKEASDPCYKNYTPTQINQMGFYNQRPIAVETLESDLQTLVGMQVYQVSERIYVAHAQRATLAIAFNEDGTIHLDGLIRDPFSKVIAVVGQIPFSPMSTGDLQDFNGQSFLAVRQFPCPDEDGVCTSSDDEYIEFDLEQYL